ncbi:hypothetical protein ABW19_dt0209511 [Dactylella cylindrospora]|nr:hypothetical protein ABW19_dt0209511 [Dactylella cylindrospora]
MMGLGLPTLTPRDTQSLWYTPSHTFGYTVPPRPNPVIQNPQPPTAQQHQRHQYDRAQRDASRSALAQYGPSALQQLAIDEDAVEKRKLHIARFGATWIKPPGMMKTLQGVIDEELERAEQMALEETTVDEIGMGGLGDVNMVGGEPVEIVEDGDEEEGDGEVGEEEEGEEGEVGEEGLMEEGEVDLDADIPEADSAGWSEDEEDEEEEEDEDEEEDIDEEDDEAEEVDLDDEIEVAPDHTSLYEEEDDEEEADELSAIAETTQDSLEGSYVSEVGDGSPHPMTPNNGSQRHATPSSSRRAVREHFQNARRGHIVPITPATPAGRSSPLRRQVPGASHRGGRRRYGADSSALFMSGDEMEVDD